MFCFGSNEASDRNRQINKEIVSDRRSLERVAKLLLLGAGDSGKSTIAKQMKIIHLDGFNEEERLSYKTAIANNILTGMRTLIHQAAKFGYGLQPDSMPCAQRVIEIPRDLEPDINPSLGSDIVTLWRDPAIQAAFGRANEYQLNDSTKYYMDDLARVSQPSYVPTEQDVLRSRVKTLGVLETTFDVEDMIFKLVDVGGQRSERRKWIHCFEGVTAIIFCVAISEFDQRLYEDNETNRMHESLTLFRELCKTAWFATTPFVVFFNKKDIFQDKISRGIPITVCFPEYTGGQNFDETTTYIRDKFLSLRNDAGRDSSKTVYSHLTCATDTDNVLVVFNAVRDIILQTIFNKIIPQ